VWFQSVSGLTPEMTAFAIPPMRVLLLLPGLEYLLACQRGLLILARRTRVVTAGTAIEAAGIGAALLSASVRSTSSARWRPPWR